MNDHKNPSPYDAPELYDLLSDGDRGPGLYPGVHFRRTRPWI